MAYDQIGTQFLRHKIKGSCTVKTKAMIYIKLKISFIRTVYGCCVTDDRASCGVGIYALKSVTIHVTLLNQEISSHHVVREPSLYNSDVNEAMRLLNKRRHLRAMPSHDMLLVRNTVCVRLPVIEKRNKLKINSRS